MFRGLIKHVNILFSGGLPCAYGWHLAVCLLLAWPCLLWSGSGACAQDKLMLEEPFDLLTIADGKETKTLEVVPVKLPNRRLPKDPKPTDKIRVRLVEDDENRDFEIQWREVKKLELFEDRVLAQAQSFTTSQKLDDAYDTFTFLLKNYPNTQGLKEAIESFWYLSAGAAFRDKRFEEALGIIEELLRQNAQYKHSESSPPLIRVLGDIAEKRIQVYLDRSDYRSARQILSRLATNFPDAKQQPFYQKIEDQLRTLAESKRDEAKQLLTAKKYTEAYDATTAMLEIWPTVGGARELAEEMTRQYPRVLVGVEQLAHDAAALRLNSFANERVGRMIDRRLMELRSIGPEGGDYVMPIGTWQRSEDNRSIDLILTPSLNDVSSPQLASLLLWNADHKSSFFSPTWAEVVGGVRLVKSRGVEATFRRSFVLPQALLDFPLQLDAGKPSLAQAYSRAAGDETHSRYVIPAEQSVAPGKPREVLEKKFTSAENAILALQRGEIDAIDRVQPADLPTLRAVENVKVLPYAVPTVHVLVPNADKPWSGNRTFRRALLYGINRQIILTQGILKTQAVNGAQVVSGPFPAPTASNDPLAYAYDSTVQPAAYEPLLSATLLTVAKRELETIARAKNEEPGKFEGITLGHWPLELHRVACKAMAKQLLPLGINVTLKELSDDPAQQVACDFVYTEFVVSEPVVDVGRLFGPDGFYPAANPHVRLGVQRVQHAATWNEAGQRLRALHRTLHEDLTVLPLWQTPEYFAVRGTVQGIRPLPVSFYQDIDQWQITPKTGPY